jgi:hypothetical protein
MRVERSVVTADPRVVAPDDLVGAAVVLAKHGVQERLARTGVPHVERIPRLYHRSGHEVLLDQRADRARADAGGNVARFELAEQRVHEDPVAALDRDLREVFVRAVHRVAGLERRHARPAEALELVSRLSRGHEKLSVFRGEAASGQHPHGPARFTSPCCMTILTPDGRRPSS